jgi:hypothetical protein
MLKEVCPLFLKKSFLPCFLIILLLFLLMACAGRTPLAKDELKPISILKIKGGPTLNTDCRAQNQATQRNNGGARKENRGEASAKNYQHKMVPILNSLLYQRVFSLHEVNGVLLTGIMARRFTRLEEGAYEPKDFIHDCSLSGHPSVCVSRPIGLWYYI